MKTAIDYLVIAILAFFLGRLMQPKQQVRIVTVTKEVDRVDTTKDEHKKITITDTKKPSGEEQKITTIVDDATTNTKEIKQTDTKVDTVVATNVPKINISALVYLDPISKKAQYGASVSKEVLGPVTVGGFLLTNKTFGISVGLDF